ncbi:sucrose-6-phosphate hydrolase [Pectinatus brassicae]|uniref:Sucrose-6-phosphate hydrolase n=1 Tax=Pectinatus brassicae TaxID=862415 RepID=A0A840UL10_9FIRM|nr:sucrose-6-phosphate hydrolase [Pectinatus brassicae]MBB5335398.1 beta-fructofuranosidase [Pectinatus brassicae]
MKTIDNNKLKRLWHSTINKKDTWHNAFHLEMPFGLINDPNGLNYFQGEYHLFYQWNPFSCEHLHKHWGYVKTTDFINYSLPQLALAPIDEFDKNGCYSGSSYIKDNILHLIYTGNVKDDNDSRSSYQILAKQLPDGTFIKEKIIIAHQPENYTAHFRDPYFFLKNNHNYLILGAQRQNLTGCTLIYQQQSDDSWQLCGELKTSYNNLGYMWECPNLLTLNNTDILLFCPQGLESKGHQYNNLYQSGYIAGKLDDNVQNLRHGKFTELDNGFDFYAPQAFHDDERTILLGWVGMPEKETDYPTINNGWLYSLTMPRQLEYKNNHLYQYPIDELKKLRKKEISYTDSSNNFSCIIPATCEVHIELNTASIKTSVITLGFNKDALIISYDKAAQEICIDRSNMSLGAKGQRSFTVPSEDKLILDLFIDKSIMELYCQEGYAAATWTYYPQKGTSPIFQIASDQAADMLINIYELGTINYSD